jgi:isoleucyl-tRNA synthetase
MRLTAWLAPLTPFTMEEAWTTRFPDGGSNCARVIPETPGEWRNEGEAERWAKIAGLLSLVTAHLEDARRDKLIGGALDAKVTVVHCQRTPPFGNDPNALDAFDGIDPAEIFRTSQAELHVVHYPLDDGMMAFGRPEQWCGGDFRVAIERLELPKCARSWRRVPDVGSDPDYPDLSARDADAVRTWDAARA